MTRAERRISDFAIGLSAGPVYAESDCTSRQAGLKQTLCLGTSFCHRFAVIKGYLPVAGRIEKSQYLGHDVS